MFKKLAGVGNNNKKLIMKNTGNLKHKFKTVLEMNSDLTPKHLVNFVIYLMQTIEKYNINGTDKKEIVISVMKNIIEEYKNNIQDPTYIENFINTILPSLIDVIVSLDRKETFIKAENVIKTTFGCI